MLTVSYESDRVVLDLGGRKRDVLLSCADAERLEHALRTAANGAELAAPTMALGQTWGAKVESFDGLVAMRFWPPEGVTCTRVPLTPAAARTFADAVKFKREQAEYKFQLTVMGG